MVIKQLVNSLISLLHCNKIKTKRHLTLPPHHTKIKISHAIINETKSITAKPKNSKTMVGIVFLDLQINLIITQNFLLLLQSNRKHERMLCVCLIKRKIMFSKSV